MRLKTLTSLSVLGSLLGCSTLTPVTPAEPAVALLKNGVPSQVGAAPRLKSSPTMVEGLYVLARQAHAEGQLSTAAQWYESVLSLQPDHVGALNALGVIRAQDGRTPEALDLFVRARDLAPSAAYIHNNLGYTLLRQDRLDEAQVALKLALQFEPGNAQARRNLELLAEARKEQAPAQTVEQPSQPAAPDRVSDAPVVVTVAPNVFELRLSTSLGGTPDSPAQPMAPNTRVAPPVEVASLAAADRQEPGYKLVLSRELALERGPFAIWTDIRGVKLEVSNGVGTSRLAKRTANRLAEAGVATARLTNSRPYRQERTQIQYLPGQKLAVKALAAQLPVPVELVEVGQLHPRVHLRLVLGHDLAGQAIAEWIDGGSTTRLAGGQPDAGQQAS